MSASYGRLGTAPCGHRGEAIVGHYYACLEGCDSGHPPAPTPVRLAGLPAHLGKKCRCLGCMGGLFATPQHTECHCAWCAYARHVTKLVVYSGSVRYTELTWDGTGNASWVIPATTATPMELTSVDALTAKGTLKMHHVFGGFSPIKTQWLATTPGLPGVVSSATMRLITGAQISLSFESQSVTVAGVLTAAAAGMTVPTGTTTTTPSSPTLPGRGWVIVNHP